MSKIETDEDSIPEGYYISGHGATYTIYESNTDKPVSLGYHEINFPKVKIGAHITTLVEKDGYFVPRELRPTIDKSEYKSDIEKEIIRISKHAIKSYSIDKFSSKINRTSENQNESNSGNSIFSRGGNDHQNNDDKNNEKDSETDKDENDDNKEIELSKSNYILILSAVVASVLEEGSNDWYIITSYDEIDPHKLQQIQNINDIRESEHPFQITDSDIERIREYTMDDHKLDRNNILNELY